jgi:hypothetical protein
LNDLQEMGDNASARVEWECVTKGTMALKGLQNVSQRGPWLLKGYRTKTLSTVLITKIKHDSLNITHHTCNVIKDTSRKMNSDT